MYTYQKVTTFKERLNDICDETGRPDVEIAFDMRVSKQTLSAWKLGNRSPREPMIIALANYFGVTTEWLMGFDVPKHEEKKVSALLSSQDQARLEALHQNPRLGLLFDRAQDLDAEDIDFMERYVERIMKERDGD